MKSHRCAWWCILLCASGACADVGPLNLGAFDFGFVPHAVTAEDVPGGQTIHGFRLSADWTAVTPDAWSAFMRLYASAPGNVTSSAVDFGGGPTAAPYHFNADRYLAILGGAPSGGDWTFRFSSTYPGTVGHLADVEITLLEAEVASYSGATTGGPEWARPEPGFDGVSGLGPVRYHVQPFTVDATGRYDIYSKQDYDGWVFLYADDFDPESPLAFGVAESDDGRTGEDSSDLWRDRNGALLTLEAGRTYYLVTTGFEDIDFGSFTTYIGGVGTVTFIPEPASAGLLLVGAVVVRRRR